MKIIVSLSLLAPTACVPTAEDTQSNATAPDAPIVDPLKACDVSAAQYAVGKPFTEALAAELRKKIGSNAVRVISPGTMVTMDYRGDRLNISYDERKIITDISCG